MFKKFLCLMVIVLTLFVTSPKEPNNIFTVDEDDYIEWNSFGIEDFSL